MNRFSLLLICTLVALCSLTAAVGEIPGRTAEDLELEKFLLTAEVVKSEEIGQGISKPKRLTLRRGDKVQRACFKTIDQVGNGTIYSRGFEADFSDRYTYEVAAYRVDRVLGMRLVPVAVVREIDGVTGSVQAWVEDTVDMQELMDLGQAPTALKQFQAETGWMLILDALIYNTDRNPTNILVKKNGSGMFLIDHSRSFRLHGRLPAWAAKGIDTVPDGARERLSALDLESLLADLEEIIGKNRTVAVDKRRKRLLKQLEG